LQTDHKSQIIINHQPHTDEELMRRIMEGHEPSFAELYDRYGQRMHRYFYRLLGQDVHRADDFTQELFLKLIQKKEMYAPSRRFSTWLYTVAGNMVKNEYRRISRQKPLPERPESFDENFSQSIDNQVFRKHLIQELEQLDEVQRECFILRYQEEMSIKEISAIMDCPEGTVKSRLFYTLRNLAAKLRAFSGVLGFWILLVVFWFAASQ
jgi:RNA polymerase sigma-70 factor (ECF subfamily)